MATLSKPVIRVVVADDHVLIRAGIAALLRAAPGFKVVAEAATGEETVAAVTRSRPDVVLMDILIPGGLAAIRAITGDRQANDDPPRVLVLTAVDLDEHAYAALRLGASGFLLKDTSPERLLIAVAMIAKGDMLFAPTVTQRLIQSYASRLPDAQPSTLRALTQREREVLRLVAAGLGNAEIAAALAVSEATVKTHLNRLMTKLGISSRAQAVVLAYESGLVTPQRSDP